MPSTAGTFAYSRLYSLRKNPDFEVAQRFNAAIRPFFSVRALAPEVPN